MKLKNWVFSLCLLLMSSAFFSQEKTVLEVVINGAKKTKVAFLKNILSTQKGQVLDSLLVAQDVILLKRLPAISNAYYQVLSTESNSYSVLFTVEENITITPDINFWTTTNKQFAYKLGVYDYNFLGRNITFGGFYQNNGFDSYALNFRAPNLFSSKWGMVVNHQNWKSEEPLYFENAAANYLYNNISFEVLGLHQIDFKNQIQFGFNFFKEKYQYLSGVTDSSIPKSLNLNKTLLKLVYTYDDLDYFYQYISGFKSVLYAQYVLTENDFQNEFYIFWNDFL